jgi:uncharacterized cupredoxin-like copper-binding protein
MTIADYLVQHRHCADRRKANGEGGEQRSAGARGHHHQARFGEDARRLEKYMQAYKGDLPATTMGGITAVRPGTTNYFELNLTPGNYILICFVPDSKDGKPHFEHGMLKQLTVN